MLQEQPEVLQEADPIGERGQNVTYSLGYVERGPPTSLYSPIHSIKPKVRFNFHSAIQKKTQKRFGFNFSTTYTTS